MKTKIIQTSLGWAGLALSDKGIVLIILPRKSKDSVHRELERAVRPALGSAKGADGERKLAKAVRQVERFLAGRSETLDLPLDLLYGTSFQKAVWKAAAEIPYGETRTYGWVAKRIGKPLASRAVGQAMGANPVPLLVP